MRRLTIAAALLCLAGVVGAAGCQEDTGGDVVNTTAPEPTAEGQVLIRGTSFNPRELRTTAGKTVTWTFDDGGLEHTVTADDESFDSGRMSTGNYTRTFDAPGTVNYHCQVHTRMRGTILVS